MNVSHHKASTLIAILHSLTLLVNECISPQGVSFYLQACSSPTAAHVTSSLSKYFFFHSFTKRTVLKLNTFCTIFCQNFVACSRRPLRLQAVWIRYKSFVGENKSFYCRNQSHNHNIHTKTELRMTGQLTSLQNGRTFKTNSCVSEHSLLQSLSHLSLFLVSIPQRWKTKV